MQISKKSDNKFVIKTKEATILVDDDGVEIEGLKFTGPGEYERKGIFVEGVRPDGEGTIFVLHAEDISICHMGKISKLLSPDAVKSLGDIDLLFVPVGADESMTPANAEKTISVIDPRIILPIHFDPSINFESVLGIKPEKVEILKLKKAELPSEDRQLILI